MVLCDKAVHYKATYVRHIAEVKKFFFANDKDALFVADLTDATIWPRLKEWLALPEKKEVSLSVHAHKARGQFTRVDLLRTN